VRGRRPGRGATFFFFGRGGDDGTRPRRFRQSFPVSPPERLPPGTSQAGRGQWAPARARRPGLGAPVTGHLPALTAADGAAAHSTLKDACTRSYVLIA